jgi:hypothetical protein
VGTRPRRLALDGGRLAAGDDRGDDRVLRLGHEVVRQRQPDDRLPRGRQLLGERAGDVGQAVPLEQLLDLRGDLLVAVARQVRVQVVLDLERQVAGHHVHGLAAGDVGGAQHLAQVPLAAGLAVDGGLLEGLDALGKWPHMMTECVHRLRTRLAVAFAATVCRNDGPDSSGCTT